MVGEAGEEQWAFLMGSWILMDLAFRFNEHSCDGAVYGLCKYSIFNDASLALGVVGESCLA